MGRTLRVSLRCIAWLGLAWLGACGGSGGAHVQLTGWTANVLNPDFVAYQQKVDDGEPVPDLAPPRFDTASVAAVRGLAPVTPPPAPGPCGFPAAYDLRTLGRVTPARDSTDVCGSCWTAATMGSLESILAPGEMRDFSEAHMQLRYGADFAACGVGGNRNIATFYLAAWRGPVNEADFDLAAQPLDTGPNAAPVQKHVQNVYYLPDRNGPLDNCWIKLAVTTLGGVYSSISRAPYGPQWDLYDAYYHPSNSPAHAVTIVGWDDNFDRNLFYCGDPSIPDDERVPAGDGAFIVKDNGGPNWHDGGFFYVSYYDGTIGTSMAVFPSEPVGNYSRIYQYDPDGPQSTLVLSGQGKMYSWQANVFTAKADEGLAAVGLYELLDPSMDYRVQVVLDPTNGPAGGTVAASVDVSMWIPGYRTVKLPQKIPLHAGQRFAVILRGHDRDGGWPASLPIERPEPGWSSIHAHAGESYVSTDGTTWQDLTQLQIPVAGGGHQTLTDTNLCIKAFTRPLVTQVANVNPGDLTVTWTLTNPGSADVWMEPVAHERANFDGVFQEVGDDILADTFQVDGGDLRTTLEGWILVPAGTTVTASSAPGAADPGDLLAYRYRTYDAHTSLVANPSIWKFLGDLLSTPLHVVSTQPLPGAQINAPGSSDISVTFDATIKAGPGLQGVRVTSSSASEPVFTSIQGDTLHIYTSQPLFSNDLGGTTWSVHVPSNAVVSQGPGNPLASDYDWSFTVNGAN